MYTSESPEPIVFRPCEERRECFVPAYGSLLFAEGDFNTLVNQRKIQVIINVSQITAIIFRTHEELEEETS
jgi:hypothetical protein